MVQYKYNVIQQILFYTEVQQLVYHKLALDKDEVTMKFFNESSLLLPEDSLLEIDEHQYLVSTSFQGHTEGHDVYGKLLKDGVMFHSHLQ